MTTSTAVPGLAWQLVTLKEVRVETSTARTLVLEVPNWPGHLPGQHVDVRVMANDGNAEVRSFSIASPPEERWLALTIDRLPGAKVSSRLCEEVRPGFQFELRGPIGTSFVWQAKDSRPLQLVAGGSGIVPLMSMLRHRARLIATAESPRPARARLLYSTRNWDDVIYRGELVHLAESDPTFEVTHTITRDPPADWSGLRRRIDRTMLSEVAWSPAERPRIYVCGPAALVESVARSLAALGHDPASILTERFGPTG